MSQIWELLTNLIPSPDYSIHHAVTSHLQDMESTAVELRGRIENLAQERDPYEALLRSMIEARNNMELLRDYEN